MKILKAAVLQIICFAFCLSAYAQTQVNTADTPAKKGVDTINLAAGESTVINTGYNITRIGVGSPDVIDATRVSEQQILINAIADGKTNLLLWSGEQLQQNFQVIVGKLQSVSGTVRDLSELLRDVEGISVRSAGERVLIEGEVYSQQEIQTINSVIAEMPSVVNLAKTSTVYNRLLAEEIQKTINLNGVRVRYGRNGYVLEGVVASQAQLEYADNIALSYTDSVINALYVEEMTQPPKPITKLVELDVRVLDINRDALLNFANDYTFSGSVTGNASNTARDSISGTFSLSDADLRDLEEQGKGRVLVEHTLISESGKQAEVFIGDELPIVIAQDGGELSTEYKRIGMSFRFVPLIFKPGIVNLDVSVGSSTQIGESIGGAPIISNVEVTTAAHLNTGTSLMLTGLVRQRQLDSYFGSADSGYKSNQTKKDSKRTKTLFNGFFGNRSDPNRFTRERREVLVLVRPTIIDQVGSLGHGRQLKKVIERSFKDQELSRYKQSTPQTKQRIYLKSEDASK